MLIKFKFNNLLTAINILLIIISLSFKDNISNLNIFFVNKIEYLTYIYLDDTTNLIFVSCKSERKF